MRAHRTIRALLYGYLRNELSDPQRHVVETHLASCGRCSDELKSLRETMELLTTHVRRPSEYRDELYWQHFAGKVERRIQLEPDHEPSRSLVGRILEMLVENRKPFGLGFASALSLLLIGFAVWSLWIKSPAPEQVASDIPTAQSAKEPPAKIVRTSLESRADDYLEQSKVLLIGLMNTDPKSVDESRALLRRQREVSRTLVRESHQLTSELNDPSQRQLKELVSDLGVILVQIANLEADHDMQGVEIVKSGVERNGILFKINLEEIQRTTRVTGNQGTQKAAKPAI